MPWGTADSSFTWKAESWAGSGWTKASPQDTTFRGTSSPRPPWVVPRAQTTLIGLHLGKMVPVFSHQ